MIQKQDDTSVYVVNNLSVTPCPTVTMDNTATCPGTKYSGDSITLQATPRDGTGPYYVEFRKNNVAISTSRLTGSGPLGSTGTNPISNVPEDSDVIRVYTLNDLDVSSSAGTIDFSVYISDSCPTGVQYCESACTITLGCLAPVCNFTVT